MFELKYRENFRGAAVGRVARDEDFAAPLGFYRNEYQIHYLFAGKRLYFVNGECYTMEKGCLALIDKNKIPKTCIIGGQYHDRMLIELKGDLFIELGRLMGFNFERLFDECYGVYDFSEALAVREIIEELDRTVTELSDMQEALVKKNILALLCLIPQYQQKKVLKNESKEAISSVSKQLRVHQVADYISGNYDRIHSVDELAERFYINKSYLCRIFKEVINFTISEYINLHRIDAARRYLMEGKYSMTEIANVLGYSSLAYFERVFKKEMSVTPFQYRKMLREKHGTLIR